MPPQQWPRSLCLKCWLFVNVTVVQYEYVWYIPCYGMLMCFWSPWWIRDGFFDITRGDWAKCGSERKKKRRRRGMHVRDDCGKRRRRRRRRPRFEIWGGGGETEMSQFRGFNRKTRTQIVFRTRWNCIKIRSYYYIHVVYVLCTRNGIGSFMPFNSRAAALF